MRQYVSPALEKIGHALQAQYNAVGGAVGRADKHLNEKEDQQREVQARLRGRSS